MLTLKIIVDNVIQYGCIATPNNYKYYSFKHLNNNEIVSVLMVQTKKHIKVATLIFKKAEPAPYPPGAASAEPIF